MFSPVRSSRSDDIIWLQSRPKINNDGLFSALYISNYLTKKKKIYIYTHQFVKIIWSMLTVKGKFA